MRPDSRHDNVDMVCSLLSKKITGVVNAKAFFSAGEASAVFALVGQLEVAIEFVRGSD